MNWFQLPICCDISKSPKLNLITNFRSRILLAAAHSKHILTILVVDSQNFRKLHKWFYEFERDENMAQKRKSNSFIVGKGESYSPFSKITPFLEVQDVPTFYRPIRKTKVLNQSFNQFLYKFYPQSILILKEYLLKWWNANLI